MRNSLAIPATLAVTAILAGIVLVGGTKLVWPHDAIPTASQPLGWAYGWECCNLMDCREVAPGAVSETPEGYVIKLTGELIPYGDKKIKPSKDEFFHHCTKQGKPEGETICLYVPDRGF
jgi:hypothetical protein